MADTYVVAIQGLSQLSALDSLPDEITRKARMAVNATIKKSRSAAAASMERQVAFPRGYLSGKEGRLTVTKLASDKDLEGKITGRDRPTSLARFVKGTVRPGGQGAPRSKGVTVEVKPGLAKRMPSAFVIKLKNNNLGLAYRSRDGSRPKSIGAKQISKGLYLLFGPSVDQVFNKTRDMIRPDMEAFMQREFERLMELNNL